MDPRRLILPQLSATGVERKLVEERTGWHAVFGPVEARDLPAYLATNHRTNEMRQVRFPLLRRLEMAVAWAFPISAIGTLILVLGWPRQVLPFVAMAWTIAVALFGFFPWLGGRIEPGAGTSPVMTRYSGFLDPYIRRPLVVWLASGGGWVWLAGF